MTIQNNPTHVENLNSISQLEAAGFVGIDADLATSLFEYGLAWRELENEFLFIHRASHGKGFDRTLFNKSIDVHKEFSWVCWNDLFNCFGTTKEKWSNYPLSQKIYDLVNYYGAENIFGTTYWEGFEIKED